MPEGDTIHRAARRIRAVLEGRVPDEIATPHPRFGRDRWPERLGGRSVDAVEAAGKHLLVRFDGGLVVHSHLRMTGAWRVLRRGERWPRYRVRPGSSCVTGRTRSSSSTARCWS
jgi:endonuclease VIII